jgi:hypothetical protein
MKIPSLPARWFVRLRRLLGVLGALVVVYAGVGFLALPAVIRAQLPKAVARTLGRAATLDRARCNPFAWSVTLEGFRIADPQGGPWAGWERLYVRLRPTALLRHTLSFRAIDWQGPYGEVTLLKGGRLDCADVLARLSAPSAAPAPAAPSRPWQVAITHLAVQRARLDLHDDTLSQPFATALGPVSLVLDGFATRPDSDSPYAFTAVTEAGESLSWTGQFSVEPLQSAGTLTLERLDLPKYRPYLQDQVRFDLRRGLATLRASYRFRWAPGDHVLQLDDGSLRLQDLELASGQGQPEVRLPSLEARGIRADLLARSAAVASLQLQDGRLDVVREPDGAINLVRLLTPKPPPQPPPPAEPFRLALDEVGLHGFQVTFLDRATVRPVTALADGVEATLRGFSLDPQAAARLDLALRLNHKATVSASGSLHPFKPDCDLRVRVDSLDLPPFDPYLAPAVDVRLTGGTLAVAGRVRGAFAGKPDDFTAFKGDLRLAGFEAMDGARREPFLRYRAFRLEGVDLRTRPAVLAIRKVDLEGPEGRLVVAPDGSTNVARALNQQAAPLPGAIIRAAVPPTAKEAWRLNVDQVALRDGRLAFIDRSLEPNAVLTLMDLAGTYTHLSTDPDTPSALDILGLAGGSAPLSIRGHAVVLRHDQDTDVTVLIQGSNLTDFSPYAGKYLGYTIQKGKLGVDAHIRIQQRQLDSLFKTRLDQFHLGERTQSPDATHLPVKLALAILRDRHGVIDLEVPVQGSLDDPQFHYGRVIWHAVLNVMTKIVASPFTLLARLAGSGDRDLSFVAFQPGTADPEPEAAAKIQALVKALDERPGLNLEAEGTADPGADGLALRRQALDRRLLELAGTPAAGPMAGDDRTRWLGVAYQKAFPPAPGAPAAQAPPPEEMEQRLLETFPVSSDDLAQLAKARTQALFKALRDARMDPARLFEVAGGERARQEGGPRVYLGLR